MSSNVKGTGWKKYFKAPELNSSTGQYSPINGSKYASASDAVSYGNYSSHLPEVYMGHLNRIERYNTYNQMDFDSEINAALDILAEFCTQIDVENGLSFNLQFVDTPTETESKILQDQLKSWFNLNKFDKRIFRIFRNVLKFGDQVFLRDPETFELFYVDSADVLKIIVNESEGKKPEQYVLRNVNPNFETLNVTQSPHDTLYSTSPTSGGTGQGGSGTYNSPTAGTNTTSGRFAHGLREVTIKAEDIMHLSLTEGLDSNWPFGNSILELIFRVYKQKELLEDAVIIYRIQRAPERRVFKIDVGDMPPNLAMAFVERIKNEMHQRRIPSQRGGQQFMDATYSTLCLDLNTRIPLLDSRTLTLNEIIEEFNNGKENWVYSCDPITGKIVPGIVNWAGITRENAETIEITLDNNEKLIVTPDHKIPILGKGFVEAKDLQLTDSLISFNTRFKSISGGRTNNYQQVWDHEDKKWIWTHRMVADFFRKLNKHNTFIYLKENEHKVKTVVHHVDFNRFNNNPNNLKFMNKDDHIKYHANNYNTYLASLTEEQRLDKFKNHSNKLKKKWQEMSTEERFKNTISIRKAQKKSVWLRKNDPIYKENYSNTFSRLRKKYFAENPEFLKKTIKNLEKRVFWKNTKTNFNEKILQRIIYNTQNSKTKKLSEVVDICSADKELLDMFAKANTKPTDKGIQCKINYSAWHVSKMKRLLKTYNYKNWKTFVKEAVCYNHKILSIVKTTNRNVGTITVDGKEEFHNYHTFAVECGIFVKNSTNEDFFFPHTGAGRGSSVEVLPGGCLEMSTRVPLLDGRTLTIAELTEEYNNGKENWAYSCNPSTGEVVPGIITWAGVTQTSANVMKIILDNNEEIIVTPDHKFPILGRGFVEAKDLKINDRLIPLNKKNEIISETKKRQYTQIYQNHTKKWEFAHRSIVKYLMPFGVINDYTFNEEFINAVKDLTHHADHNRYNNDPSNLVRMNWVDHKLYHQHYGFDVESQKLGTIAAKKAMAEIKADPIRYAEHLAKRTVSMQETIAKRTEEKKQEIFENLSAANKLWIANLTEEEKEKHRNTCINNLEGANEKLQIKLQTDPEFYDEWLNAKNEGWEAFKLTPEYEERSNKLSKSNKIRMSDPKVKEKIFANQRIKYSKEVLDNIQTVVKNYTGNKWNLTISVVADIFNQNDEMRNLHLTLNKDTKAANWNKTGITPGQVKAAVGHFGYSGWKQFKKEVNEYNHAIIGIEYLPDQIEVGTLTIDGDERFHNFHTFALGCGVFTKNSSVGEVGDLSYFNNKMMRGLRIPSSYLPTGAEESPAQYNDGRVGTALIQEFRFNQYCQRLQNLIVSVLDTEFKTYLKWRGINIDSSIFNLKFNEPQNFAHYRQAEIDGVKIATFSQMEGYQYFSKRFLMKRYLGMTPEEMAENDTLWREENVNASDVDAENADLRNLGITPGGIEGDLSNLGPEGDEMGDMEAGPEGDEMGDMEAGTPGGSATPIGGGPGAGNPIASQGNAGV